MDNKNYIFICGSGRCGTTLLRNIFDLHKDISVAPELRFFDLSLTNITKFKNLSDRRTRENFIDVVLNKINKSKDPLWNNIKFNREELKKELMGCSSIGLIYEKFIESCSTKKEKNVYVDKIPTFFVGNAIKYLPNSRVIHIIRDGREVCASAKKRGDWAESIINIAVFWRESLRQYKI